MSDRDDPQWRNDWRPPRAQRPGLDEPLLPGVALMLVLDSIATVLNPGPINAVLTPEEVEQVSAYIRSRPGPAGDAERRRQPQASTPC